MLKVSVSFKTGKCFKTRQCVQSVYLLENSELNVQKWNKETITNWRLSINIGLMLTLSLSYWSLEYLKWNVAACFFLIILNWKIWTANKLALPEIYFENIFFELGYLESFVKSKKIFKGTVSHVGWWQNSLDTPSAPP